MRFAETVRSRWFLALGSVVAAGTAVAMIATCPTRTEARQPTKSHIPRITACKERVKRAPVVAMTKKQVTGADYQEALAKGRPGYESCVAHQPPGVTYAIRIPISPTGKATSVEVRGEAQDLSKVNLRVVKCLEIVSSHLRFPATGEATAVSTSIRTQ